jgi:hypothetical protein
MGKPAHLIVTPDDEIDEAIQRSALRSHRAVIAAAYRQKRDEIVVRFADGVQLTIPRQLVEGLQHATAVQLRQITIEGPGTGLVWPALDVAHYVPGLIAGIFGTREWMAEIGRRGGERKSRAKAVAARLNGAKGGRPRKPVSPRTSAALRSR